MSRLVHNPFPFPTPLEKRLLEELVEVAFLCYQRGWTWGTAGNFSLRGSRELVWLSPSGLCKGRLDPKGFIPVDRATGSRISPAAGNPSGEMPVHLGIYHTDPNAGAVVHAHPPAVVQASRSGVDLEFSGEEMQKALGAADHLTSIRVPVVENPLPIDMPSMVSKVPECVQLGVPSLVLAAHGVYAWGTSPLAALAHIEALEFLCRTR